MVIIYHIHRLGTSPYIFRFCLISLFLVYSLIRSMDIERGIEADTIKQIDSYIRQLNSNGIYFLYLKWIRMES